MDGWKNKCNECGLELNVMVMNYVTEIFAVTVHWPSASGTDFERSQAGVPLLSLPCVVRQFRLLDFQSDCRMFKVLTHMKHVLLM
jgi:hypothetical protein